MSKSKKLSLTFSVDSGVIEHNNRTFKAKNVDADWTSDNIIYKSENLQEKYHEIYDEALEKYNAKKRSNEKIHDYYEHIRKGKQEKPFYEVVVQFEDISSCGVKSGNWETAKQMLDEYIFFFPRTKSLIGKSQTSFFQAKGLFSTMRKAARYALRNLCRYYDAILMDLRMSVMDSYEAADAFSEDKQRCLANGTSAHVSKPIDVREVINHLKKAYRQDFFGGDL